jgi:hypothetical protein
MPFVIIAVIDGQMDGLQLMLSTYNLTHVFEKEHK